MKKIKREYTVSRAALRQRKAASARASKVRRPATAWRSIRVPAELAARIDAARIEGGDAAAWQAVERAIDRAFPF